MPFLAFLVSENKNDVTCTATLCHFPPILALHGTLLHWKRIISSFERNIFSRKNNILFPSKITEIASGM